MTIQEFYVESYGQLRNFHVKDLSPGLNVFLGPNASGKETLMSFLNHVLLGAKRYESPRAPLGGQKGGRIVMDDDVVIERLDHKIQPHGRIQSAADIRDIFLDRAIIESVFFVSLDQLSFSDLQNAQSFPGALVDSYSRLEHARKHLEGARDRLWRFRAASEIRTVEKELKRVREPITGFDESILIAKLREKRREFAEILIAEQLLSEVVKPYEDEHQRVVYARANEFIRRATDGEYEVVAGHPGERGEFVRSQDGTMYAESELSRGTRELILMLLRLSLVLDCAERNRRLPLIMDDVMVHMDDERAEAFAKVLGEVSKHVQIFIFTSREDTQQRLARYADSQKTLILKRFPSDLRSAYAQK